MVLALHKCVWGPRYWAVLHTAALTYSPSDVIHDASVPRLKDALKSLALNVPCSECRPHAKEYFTANQQSWDDANTSEELSEFFVNFHNAVSAKLDKVQFTVAQAEKRWEQLDSNGGATALAMVMVGGASLLLGIVIGRAGRQCELRCQRVISGAEE